MKQAKPVMLESHYYKFWQKKEVSMPSPKIKQPFATVPMGLLKKISPYDWEQRKDNQKVIRYSKLKGTKSQKRVQFRAQLDKFENDAKAGQILNLSDLIGNGESFVGIKHE